MSTSPIFPPKSIVMRHLPVFGQAGDQLGDLPSEWGLPQQGFPGAIAWIESRLFARLGIEVPPQTDEVVDLTLWELFKSQDSKRIGESEVLSQAGSFVSGGATCRFEYTVNLENGKIRLVIDMGVKPESGRQPVRFAFTNDMCHVSLCGGEPLREFLLIATLVRKLHPEGADFWTLRFAYTPSYNPHYDDHQDRVSNLAWAQLRRLGRAYLSEEDFQCIEGREWFKALKPSDPTPLPMRQLFHEIQKQDQSFKEQAGPETAPGYGRKLRQHQQKVHELLHRIARLADVRKALNDPAP